LEDIFKIWFGFYAQIGKDTGGGPHGSVPLVNHPT